MTRLGLCLNGEDCNYLLVQPVMNNIIVYYGMEGDVTAERPATKILFSTSGELLSLVVA